jgi:cell fate regulator YaaT (PSP1 superfamily)
VADVVGIVFPNGTKTYYFDPAGLELARGDRVVVQTANGPEIGQVVEPNHTIEDSELPAPLKKVTRLATGKDLEAQAASQNLRKQALITCREMIASHRLDMKLVGADISFGGEKITFSFYAEERVDFRSLVADLAKALKTRIELRQVGAREEARMVGGLGPCGRSLCCTLFPPGDEPVSIRMAKEQNLPLNPAKISGLCGRLMCCLKYEQEQYVRFRKEAPPKGTPVQTPGGPGAVVGYNVLKDAITVRLEDGHATDIKLCCCQCQADGGLLVVPELGEPASPPEFFGSGAESAFGAGRATIEEEEDLAVIEAEVVLGEDGEPIQVVVAEGSRRRRRGRGRRAGRGRARIGDEGGTAGETGAAGEPAAAASGRTAGAPPEGGRGGRGGAEGGGVRHQSQHGQRHPERHRGGVPGHKTEGGAAPGPEPRRRPTPAGGGAGPGEGAHGGPGPGQEGAGTGTSSSARRRRRRRRPGGGGDGPNGGEGGGAGGGSAPGAAPGGD